MRVKIKKAKCNVYWYANSKYIGREYEVIDFDNEDYQIIDNGRYLLKADCEIVPEIDYTIPGTPLPTQNKNKENMNYQITPDQAKSIIEIACKTWKKKLAEKWAVKIMLDETIEVSDEFYKEMISASDGKQTTLLNSIFKPDEINLRDKSTINNLELFQHDGSILSTLIAIRESQEYEDKAFYLNDLFDWNLHRDSEGVLCLIPTKQQ